MFGELIPQKTLPLSFWWRIVLHISTWTPDFERDEMAYWLPGCRNQHQLCAGAGTKALKGYIEKCSFSWRISDSAPTPSHTEPWRRLHTRTASNADLTYVRTEIWTSVTDNGACVGTCSLCISSLRVFSCSALSSAGHSISCQPNPTDIVWHAKNALSFPLERTEDRNERHHCLKTCWSSKSGGHDGKRRLKAAGFDLILSQCSSSQNQTVQICSKSSKRLSWQIYFFCADC